MQPKIPRLLCSSGKEIGFVCTREACKSKTALFCESQECKVCFEEHLECESVKLSKVIVLVEKKTGEQIALIEQLLAIEKKLMAQIQSETNKMIKKVESGIFPPQFQKSINKIFNEQKRRAGFPSVEARQLISFLRERK